MLVRNRLFSCFEICTSILFCVRYFSYEIIEQLTDQQFLIYRILADAEPSLFDLVIINDNFDRAYNDFIKAVEKELTECMSLKDGVKAAVVH